jgi:hypothetical protein
MTGTTPDSLDNLRAQLFDAAVEAVGGWSAMHSWKSTTSMHATNRKDLAAAVLDALWPQIEQAARAADNDGSEG